MDRRSFLGAGAAGPIAAASGARAQAPAAANSAPASGKFKLKYAPMFGAFEAHAGKDPIAQLNFMSEAGFTALLDGGFLGKPQELQDTLAREIERHGMTLGGPYCSHTAGGQSHVAGTDKKDEYAKHDAGVCEKLKRANGRWFLVVPGALVKGMAMEQMTVHLVENLKAIMQSVEPTGCILTLEPLNPRNHPGLFLYLCEQKFDGVLGMEHGKSKGGKEGELALIHACRWCDAFDQPYKIRSCARLRPVRGFGAAALARRFAPSEGWSGRRDLNS